MSIVQSIDSAHIPFNINNPHHLNENELNNGLDTSPIDIISSENGNVSCRRSSRKIRKPTLFKITHEKRPDPELSAAIKRSRLDTHHSDVDYSSIKLVPTIHATLEEFDDPILLWDKYSHLGMEYGAIKVIPPQGWKIHLPFDPDTFKFNVRKQELKQLSTGNGFSHPSRLWTCSKMREYNMKLLRDIMSDENPSLESIEEAYWNLLKNGDSDVTTFYGADLNVYSTMDTSNIITSVSNEPWHPLNLPNSDGSLLKYMKSIVPGVNLPWFYIGMCFTSFCWHTEDDYFGSINYHHSGAPKVWYIIPPKNATKMERLLKNYTSMKGDQFALYSLRVQIPPDVLLANNITIYRIVQQENEFVLVWPRTFHAGFNAGFNCNEACNIAPGSWIMMGYKSLLNYKFARKTCIPFYRIIFSALPSINELHYKYISQIIECISSLLMHEYELRHSLSYPKYQMYLNLNEIYELNELQEFFYNISKDDFDQDKFIESLMNLECSENNIFLAACKELASFSIKDCDLCDCPTFTSCLICNHIDAIVCLTCIEYHECHCKTRAILYRYPLISLYNMISILKKIYKFKAGYDWVNENCYRLPRMDTIMKQDSESYFSCSKLINFQGNHNEVGEEMLDEEYNNSYDDIISYIKKKADAGQKVVKRRNKEDVQSREITISYPDVIFREYSKYPTSKINTLLSTKLTLKYTILAVEEDKNENV